MEIVPVLEEDAPAEREPVGLVESVLLLLGAVVAVKVGEAVLVTVGKEVGVAVQLCVAVAELLSELVPELEADAPAVRVAVGEADTVLLPLAVVLGVDEGVLVGVGVETAVDELEGVA